MLCGLGPMGFYPLLKSLISACCLFPVFHGFHDEKEYMGAGIGLPSSTGSSSVTMECMVEVAVEKVGLILGYPAGGSLPTG